MQNSTTSYHEGKMESHNGQEHIYVVLSATPTKFGGLIRKIIKQNYNHASLAFDKELERLFSFGRKQHKVPIVAGLVKEYPERFSLKKADNVQVCIFEIDVTKEQYEMSQKRLSEIFLDEEEYLYNLFSVLTYPVFHGFSTYKAFSCVEFVIHMLEYIGIEMPGEKKRYEYTPEELRGILPGQVIFEGNLLDYCNIGSQEGTYYFMKPKFFKSSKDSCTTLVRLAYRKISKS